ncbi:MAG TPA: hypothetical protein PK721_06785 [Flexilinea sp.]|nr:hypothetical protein [Flexilinea sp.]
MTFRPKVNETIKIDNKEYKFTEHPSVKGMPYGQTGRRATVYQLKDSSNNLYALKVFTMAYCSSQTEKQAHQIAGFQTMTGMEACKRVVLSPSVHVELLRTHPELNYAVLMPWVKGISWQEVILNRTSFDSITSMNIAGTFIRLLRSLEQMGVAHCDISGPNVMLNINQSENSALVSLIDLEDLFMPGLNMPAKLPAGSAGYDHPEVRKGVWCPEADRFSGSVLIAEILGWCDERVRRIASSEQYFDPSEIQSSCDRYKVLSQVLRETWGVKVAEVFSQAWFSSSLKDCPTFSDWEKAIDPTPDPSELRAKIARLERIGNWEELLKTCDDLLRLDGSQFEIWSIRAKGQLLQKTDAEISKAWNIAAASGKTDDWETCLKIVNTAELQGPEVIKYQAERTQAEQELDTALKMDQVEELIQQGKITEAQRLLASVSATQPRCITILFELNRLLEQEKWKEEKRIAAQQALAQGEWHTVLDILNEVDLTNEPPSSEFLEMKKKAEKLEIEFKEAERKAQELSNNLEEAKNLIKNGDYSTAEQLVELILQAVPNNPDALEIKEIIQKYNNSKQFLENARKKSQEGEIIEAIELLKCIPASFEDASLLQSNLKDRLDWRMKLNRAYDEWRPEDVLLLLKTRPSEEAPFLDLEKWANEMILLKKSIETAEQAKNWEELIRLLDSAPNNYPGLSVLSDKVSPYRQKQALKQKFQQGMAAYDCEKISDLLNSTASTDECYEEYNKWLQNEIRFRDRIEKIYLNYNLNEGHQILKEFPEDHPLREGFLDWLEKEDKVFSEISSAMDSYNTDRLQKIADELPENHPLKNPLRIRLEEERERASVIKQARELFDGETVLRKLYEVDENYPDYVELSGWARAEVNIQFKIRQSILHHQDKEIEEIIKTLAPNHPYLKELETWIKREHNRQNIENKSQRIKSFVSETDKDDFKNKPENYGTNAKTIDVETMNNEQIANSADTGMNGINDENNCSVSELSMERIRNDAE